MKHMVGDTVRIKSIEWYEKNKNGNGFAYMNGRIFVHGMSEYCGMTAKVIYDSGSSYKLDIDSDSNGENGYWWNSDFFEEDYIQEENIEEEAVVQQINNSTSKPIDWEQRFYEISKDILQGICAHVGNNFVSSDVKLSLIYADELIKQLKEREGIK